MSDILSPEEYVVCVTQTIAVRNHSKGDAYRLHGTNVQVHRSGRTLSQGRRDEQPPWHVSPLVAGDDGLLTILPFNWRNEAVYEGIARVPAYRGCIKHAKRETLRPAERIVARGFRCPLRRVRTSRRPGTHDRGRRHAA
ncbi:hypothetical protein MKI84_19680 [Ancylobacter sp. A5.8]|uniref:hypothetical protein n=1 Tax=Ancylobacter gelatini TaxID=2919920 RepID=UPI001F4D844F|nr:hypothetical protein [Ancylobacter gelatini]MCJ8145147.1 hypothetical protein [Ancylobacter gelatini]